MTHRDLLKLRRLRAGSLARAGGLLALPALALGLFLLSPALPAGAATPAGATGASGFTPGALNAQQKQEQATNSYSSGGPVQPIDTHLSKSQLATGKTLFDVNCSSCHGIEGQGSSQAPNLQGLGPGVPYLWISAGWMPLANPTSEPIAKPSLFSNQDAVDIAEYVGTIKPGGQPIWSVDLSKANEAEGLSLFALNCAPCHTITGAGDALSDGQFAPSLHGVSATRVAEAVRQGPGNMPVFSNFVISNTQLADIADYVTKEVKHPDNVGGLGLGGVGPVAEGFIGLFVGVGGCVVGALWIGERAEDEEGDGEGGEHHDAAGDDATHQGATHDGARHEGPAHAEAADQEAGVTDV